MRQQKFNVGRLEHKPSPSHFKGSFCLTVRSIAREGFWVTFLLPSVLFLAPWTRSAFRLDVWCVLIWHKACTMMVPHLRNKQNPLDTNDTSFCFVVYHGVIFCECGQIFLLVLVCFSPRLFCGVGIGWGVKAIGRKMWCTCPVCTFLFLFCKKSWKIFLIMSKWWKMLLSILVFICQPKYRRSVFFSPHEIYRCPIKMYLVKLVCDFCVDPKGSYHFLIWWFDRDLLL